MKLKRTVAVAFLLAFDFAKAGEWDDEKLVKMLNQVPEKVDAADVPEEFTGVYKGLCDAKGAVEIVGASKDKEAAADEAPAKAKKKAKAEPASEEPDEEPDVDDEPEDEKEAKPAKPAAKSKKEVATNGVSYAGRSAFIRKLCQTTELTPKEVFEKTKDKYPGSSPFNVNKIIHSARKKDAKRWDAKPKSKTKSED